MMVSAATLYVPQKQNSEFYAHGHYYSDCPALRRKGQAGGRPAEQMFPMVLFFLLRDLCRRCERRALLESRN